MRRKIGKCRGEIICGFYEDFADIVVTQADLGTPLPNVIMKLSEGEEGEVLVKTPSLFLGYIPPCT